MRMNSKLLLAFGVGFVATAGATLAQSYGRGRNVQFVDGAAISPSSVTSSGAITGDTLTATTTSTDAIYLNSGRPICMNAPTCNAASRLFYNGSAIQAGGGIVAATVNSTAASGAPGYTCSNVGCRLSLGNTGRYLVDDGTNLEFVAPVQATSFEAMNTSGASISGGNDSNALTFISNSPDSYTSTTVPGILFQLSQAVTSGDLALGVKRSDGTTVFGITSTSQARVGPNGEGTFLGRYLSAVTTPVEVGTFVAAASENKPIRFSAASARTSDLAQIVTLYNASTEIAHFSKDGLLRVNQANAAKPTCNADNRGRVFYLDGAAGVADTYEICMKDASDVYAWKTIVAP